MQDDCDVCCYEMQNESEVMWNYGLFSTEAKESIDEEYDSIDNSHCACG